MARILGVDPGSTGALALLIGRRKIKIVDIPVVKIKRGKRMVNWPDPILFVKALRKLGTIDHAYLEKVSANPKHGASAMFTFGRCVGIIETAIAAEGIPLTQFTSMEWKKALRVKKEKVNSRAKALALFPTSDKFSRVKDDGRADAALIAYYGRKQYRKDL
jgi:crossover junction endodeoxyribonuclease RuvC